MEVTYGEMNFEDDQAYFGGPPKENWMEWIFNRKRTWVLFSAVAVLIALTCITVLSLTVLKADYSDEIGNQNNLYRIKREKLLEYLHEASSAKECISGIHFCDPANYSLQHTWEITNTFIGVVSVSLPRLDANSTEWKTFIEYVISLWNKHHLVELYWGSNSPFLAMDIFTFKPRNIADREKKWKDLMLEGSFLNTKWKEQLDLVAPHLQKLQTAGVVPILNILPDISGEFYTPYFYECIWRGRPGVNGSSKVHKMTQDYLKQKHNSISVIWVWSISPESIGSNIEEYWPGDDYVDVVSVYMWWNRQLRTNQYQKLVNLSAGKPMSMELMISVPTTQLLAAQPRWTWFTAIYDLLGDEHLNPVNKVQATFNSISVINAGNITYFDNTN